MTQDKSTDRLPPHAPEAEQGVLGCVLNDAEPALNLLSERRVTPEWFYDLRHQILFHAMLDLHQRRDVPVDSITLGQQLKDNGKLEECGGLAYLMELPAAAPSGANLPYWLSIVREKWVTRRLISTCTSMAARAYEHDGRVEHLLAEAEHEVESLSGTLIQQRERPIKDVLRNDVLPQLEEHYMRGRQKLRGLSTGLTYLDKIIRGIRSNYYFVVAARPGDGKTSWAMNLVEYTAALGLAVGVFTLEMTADSLTTRLLFSVADVNSGRFEEGFASESDFQKLTVGAAKLCEHNIYLDAEPDQTIEMIAAKARRMAREHGIKLFVLDYLQLLDDDSEKYRNDRVQALRRISKKIVSLKNKLNIPWLVLAQMNRNIETSDVKRAPVLSDLKECGAIEQDADVVMFLYPPLKVELEDDTVGSHYEAIQTAMAQKGVGDRMDWPKRVNAAVAKNRYGPTGTAQLLFEKNRCRFKDWRDWVLAHGLAEYGKGERASANPEAQQPEMPTNEELDV